MSCKFPLSLLSLILLATVLSSCSGNQNAEGLFTPDPQLETPTTTTVTVTPPALSVPPEFPESIPIYPEAEIKAIAPDLKSDQGMITWESSDPSNLISSYYQQELESQGWVLSPETTENQLKAEKDNFDLEVTLDSSASLTEIIISYQPQATPTPETETETPKDTQIYSIHQQYIQDLTRLGIFGETEDFQPEQIVTRREYARWLLETNNRFHQNNPSQQIKLASQGVNPAFEDVTPDDPDFAIIQGLAEAGIIPSPLSRDVTATRFNPDTPLNRGDLIAWKVPLDYRKALPITSIDDIRQTWGFQDVTDIEPRVLQALYIDYQTGEAKSNVRRAFGFTTLFQPDKSVTRIEAAAVLWHFGYQNQGISAAEVQNN